MVLFSFTFFVSIRFLVSLVVIRSFVIGWFGTHMATQKKRVPGEMNLKFGIRTSDL